ncbi:unnamed protein product [Neospora caninum Liverpool]|uniref:Rhoptry neck protein, putative n=1 Tax=Neospora caninum (strain Liverpool) TaxID=572307 RepID=F0VBF2_NEOCL|nr:uncharacterized protein NCLIV_040110 [Neospora caninum Liverpool]CBZ50936.1 unnamed protein product [Neospora caninum Liverpool]CEL68237.1 TPA: rhoptry neck protein, putative [Neospora caninum Liverpool]|eukprot:XP_003880969.1 uncharacterized protein NCLIV_040110 [Neospora caninum Liverpool]
MGTGRVPVGGFEGAEASVKSPSTLRTLCVTFLVGLAVTLGQPFLLFSGAALASPSGDGLGDSRYAGQPNSSGNTLVDIAKHETDTFAKERPDAAERAMTTADTAFNQTGGADAAGATAAQNKPSPSKTPSEQETDNLLALDTDREYNSPAPNVVRGGIEFDQQPKESSQVQVPQTQSKPDDITPDRARIQILASNLEELRSMLEDPALELAVNDVQQQIEVLRLAGVPLEASVPMADNLNRLHVTRCRSRNNAMTIPCTWQDTILFEELSTDSNTGLRDEEQMVMRAKVHKLENAFNTVTGLGFLPAGSAADTLARLYSDYRLGTGGTKVLKHYGLSNLMDLAKSRQEGRNVSWDPAEISRKLVEFHHYKNALLVRLYIMALIPQNTQHGERDLSPVDFVREVFAAEGGHVMSTARLKPLLSDDLVVLGVPQGFSFLWLFEFLLEEVLTRHLPDGWQDIVVNAFTFTAHSAALMQVVNYHSLFRDRTLGDLQKASYLAAPPSFSIERQSVVERCDKQIYEWSRVGFSPDVLEADLHNETFKGRWKNLRLETMPTPDTYQWWRRLHRIIVDSLEKYQVHERHLKDMNDNLYTLVEDTLQKLKEANAADNTIFFGRIARQTRESAPQKMWRGIKAFFLGLVRDVPGSDHAVWFGVSFNFSQIFQILRRMKEIAIHTARNQDSAILLDEAFVELVQETVAVRAQTYRRQHPTTLRNIGVIGLRPDYANLDAEQRSTEYQLSMCADHCVSLWQQVLGFIYPYVLNSSLLVDYEKSFGRDHAIKKLDDHSYVNSLRYILTSDAALNFFEHNTPQETRKAIVALKNGQAFMYANMMRFAGVAYQQLNMPYLAGSIQRQAPFMGQMVKDWVLKRSRSRKLAILSALSLGLIFVYTLLSALDIAQYLTDSGMKAVEDCTWNSIMQEMACVAVAGSGVVVAPLFAAISDVFKVGLYSGIGSTLVSASVIGNAYMIIRSESRTILRTEMAIKSMALKLWKQVRRFFSWATRFTKRRKAILSTMMARATALAKKNKRRGQSGITMTRSGDSVVDTLLEETSPAATEGAQTLTAAVPSQF